MIPLILTISMETGKVEDNLEIVLRPNEKITMNYNNRQAVSLHPLVMTPALYKELIKYQPHLKQFQRTADNLQELPQTESDLKQADNTSATLFKPRQVKRRLLYEFEANGEKMTVEETTASGGSSDDGYFNPNFVISSTFNENADVSENAKKYYYIPSPPLQQLKLGEVGEMKSQERREKNIKGVEEIQSDNINFIDQTHIDSPDIISASDDSNDNDFNKKISPTLVQRSVLLNQVSKHNMKIVMPKLKKIQYDHAAEEKVLSADGGRKTRKQFCTFCKQLVAKLPNHVEAIHKKEEVVHQLKSYPKGHVARQEILKTLRRRGTEEYNGNRMYNKGVLIVARRPKVEQQGSKFLPCANCSQLIQARKLHKHYKRCNNITSTAAVDRYYHALSKKKQANIHVEACDILKDRVMPFMRVDQFSDAIRFDRLAIAYGNSMCFKYSTSTHHDSMIRSHLRFLGHLILEARTLNSAVTNLHSLMTPAMHDTVAMAIQNIAGFSPMTGDYRAPTTATMLALLVKKVTYTCETLCITANDMAALKLVNNFRTLFITMSYPHINKTVEENRIKLQRRKHVKLPSFEDINKLATFLKQNCDSLMKKLQSSKTFNFTTWRDLGAYLMGAIMVLNRRRPGEMQRIEMDDYNAVLQVDKHHLEYKALSADEKELANKLQLFVIRGKLNRSVQVVFQDWMKDALEVFIDYRVEAGVPDTNPYVFGLPGGGGLRHNYLTMGKYMRMFAVNCGATDPKTLRATILRKHLATVSAAQDSSNEAQIQNLANHLGHADYIHKNVYTQKGINKNLLQVVKLLQNAQGDDPPQDLSDNGTPVSNNSGSRNSSQPQTTTPRETITQNQKPLQNVSEDIEVSPSTSNGIYNSILSNQPQPRKSFKIIQQLSPDKSELENCKVFISDDSRNAKLGNRRKKKPRIQQQSSTESDFEDNDSELEDDPKAKLQPHRLCKRKISPQQRFSSLDVESPQKQSFIWNSNDNRTPPQRKRKYKSRDVKKRQQWTPRSVNALKTSFSSHIAENTLPSMSEIRLAKLQQPILRVRTTPVIKTAISNILKKSQTE